MARPWYALPAAVAAALRPHIPEFIDEADASIRDEFPEHAALPPAFWEHSRLSVSRSIEGFVVAIEAGEPKIDRGTFELIGTLQARAGRDIEETLSAFRLGGAAAWRRVVELGEEAGLTADVLFSVAESLFVYIDELSGICARAYAEQHALAAGAAEVRRAHFVRLLLLEPPPDVATLTESAEAAGCRLNQSFAMLTAPDERHDELLAALPAYVVPGPPERAPCALVPDPQAPQRVREIADAVERAETLAGLGPTVGVDGIARSLRHARGALRLAESGIVTGPLALAEEHVASLLLSGDHELGSQLVASVLAPLASMGDRVGERLESTLSAWIRSQGSLKVAAAELEVHPKTLKYRLDQLRELFDGRLDAPDTRFEVELALRVRALLQPDDPGRD